MYRDFNRSFFSATFLVLKVGRLKTVHFKIEKGGFKQMCPFACFKIASWALLLGFRTMREALKKRALWIGKWILLTFKLSLNGFLNEPCI